MSPILEAGYEAPEKILPLDIVRRKELLARIVLSVFFDEWCFQLAEVNMTSPLPGKGIRRYQVIWVIRDDKISRFQKDLGPASGFVGDQFIIPGGFQDKARNEHVIVHKVGELVDIAEEWRLLPSHTLKYEPRNWREELIKETNLQLRAGQGRIVVP